MPRLYLTSCTSLLVAMVLSNSAYSKEYYIGGPVKMHDMEIVANYLIGVEMAPMLPTMVHGPDVIHLEADVHATADSVFGYADAAWVPYLTITYQLTKKASAWIAKGTLKPMVARDGPHYADDIKMDGVGDYQLTYSFESPERAGFFRHVDAETGVPEWWKPFSQTFNFKYPQ